MEESLYNRIPNIRNIEHADFLCSLSRETKLYIFKVLHCTKKQGQFVKESF
ncbi:MAG: hypothetical protein K0R80_727 [Clostridia bacterium]|jgi:hypothetical protein|nr:hypothetical protein [Clostridia bacterium]